MACLSILIDTLLLSVGLFVRILHITLSSFALGILLCVMLFVYINLSFFYFFFFLRVYVCRYDFCHTLLPLYKGEMEKKKKKKKTFI